LFFLPEVRRNQNDSQNYQDPEPDVQDRKEAGREVVKNDETGQARHERDVIFYRLACQLPQVVFPLREGAGYAQGRLCSDKTHGGEMGYAEERLPYKGPSKGGARKDGRLAAYGKQHVEKMDDHDKVCKQRVEEHQNGPVL
jgi:hypothetical protein